MQKFITVLFFVFGLTNSAFAQESRFELFGGYSYLRESQLNWNGWAADVAGNVNRWLAVTAAFDGHYHSETGVSVFGDALEISAHEYSYTAGPRVSLRNASRLTPFVFATFGGVHLGGTSGAARASLNGFAMNFGGGVDVRVNERVSVRLVQADGFYSRIKGDSETSPRVSTGLVIHFGHR